MRIHTNHLTAADIYGTVSDLPGVFVDVNARGSRSHERAFEVRLTGTSPYRTMDGQDQAATWDEWGVFFARLFNLDANMVAGSVKNPNYANAHHFHTKTADRFEEFVIPADTHPRHKWEYAGGFRNFTCTKCSAEMIGS